MKIKDDIFFLQTPEEISEEEAGEPENIRTIPDARFLANIIPRRMIDIHRLETVGINFTRISLQYPYRGYILLGSMRSRALLEIAV